MGGLNRIPEEIIVEARDKMRAVGIANSNMQTALDEGYNIYRQGWRPIYLTDDKVSTIIVAREDPDMTIAN